MINIQQLTTGVLMGTVLIMIGLVPGFLDKWANAISSLAGLFLYRIALGSREPKQIAQHRWVAALGMVLIALSLFLYTAR
jgi:hypothetical protein